MTDQETHLEFERNFVELLDELRETAGLSHTEFAQAAFEGRYGDPVRKWRQIRNIHSTIGKPQALNIRDAYLLCEALNRDFPSVAFLSQQRTAPIGHFQDAKEKARQRFKKKINQVSDDFSYSRVAEDIAPYGEEK